MTLVELDLTRTVSENAQDYYEKAKKAKSKIEGLKRAIAETKAQLESLKAEKELEKKARQVKAKRERAWVEKFHWFVSSDGILVLAGRDAKQNEIVVKKYLDDNDYYCHADVVGAPQVSIKAAGREVPQATKQEAAVFAASYSKAWKSGSSTCDVFFAKPSQVSKTAQAGEFMGTGAFMVRGEREWVRHARMELALGVVDFEGKKLLACAPRKAIEAGGKALCAITPGEEEKSAAAKKILARFPELSRDGFTLDDLLSVLPSNGVKVSFPHS